MPEYPPTPNFEQGKPLTRRQRTIVDQTIGFIRRHKFRDRFLDPKDVIGSSGLFAHAMEHMQTGQTPILDVYHLNLRQLRELLIILKTTIQKKLAKGQYKIEEKDVAFRYAFFQLVFYSLVLAFLRNRQDQPDRILKKYRTFLVQKNLSDAFLMTKENLASLTEFLSVPQIESSYSANPVPFQADAAIQKMYKATRKNPKLSPVMTEPELLDLALQTTESIKSFHNGKAN